MDEATKSMFAAMGYPDEPDNELVEVYQKFKMNKDRIAPGRLSAEGYATIAALYEMNKGYGKKSRTAVGKKADSKVNKKPETPPEKPWVTNYEEKEENAE